MREARAVAAFVFAGCAAIGTPACTRAAPVVAACANPALPQAILDGPLPASDAGTRPLPAVEVTGPGVRLTLAVAADEHSRELGLMCVTRLRPQRGMIFVFGRPLQQEFWMKNTLVPLDMIWVGADGRITTVAQRVPASTRETPDDAVARRLGYGAFVIELRSGEAAPDGLRPGVLLSIPKLQALP
jgi:uncharacterized membrane protein (UPF0127 family)